MGRIKTTKINTLSAIVLVLAVFCSTTVLAGSGSTLYSIGTSVSTSNTANWSYTINGTSCNCTPDFSKDIVNINRTTSSETDIVVGSGATINVSGNAAFNVNGDLTFNNGSIVNVASGSTLYASGTIENKNNSNQVTVNGVISAGGDFVGGNGSSLSGSGTLTTVGTATVTGGSVFGSTTSCTSSPCTASASNPLPVKFLFFSAKLDDAFNVQIDWATASEINNAFFQLERSKDGIYFDAVTKISGQGNSNAVVTYESTDISPLPGISYYRLKQVDFDGKSSYSTIVAINTNESDLTSAAFGFSVFPNPSASATNLIFHHLENEEQLYLQIYDFSGRVVYNDFINARNGSITNVDLSNFESGIYMVSVSMNEYSAKQKLVINGNN